ncbi:MAG: hypothetical protein OXG46_01235 [Chloroflexi bacterium]|nr:hypothetical protein [Chloroflexota bacterium]
MIFNELSIHGQFHDLRSFRDAIGRVMAIRGVARRFGRELQCHRNVVNAQVTPDSTMPRAVRNLSTDKRRVLMQWLIRRGPFWEDVQQHGGDDWLEYEGNIVTDTAVGEAAYCLFHGIDRRLVSINPSCWLTSPLSVAWNRDGRAKSVDVRNYWDADELATALAAAPFQLESWRDLETVASRRYPVLTFSSDTFEPLHGHPFNKGVAQRLLAVLAVLHDFKHHFDERGQRTSEGHEMYQQYFTGAKAWFSDSSDTEKARFERELTFSHPADTRRSLFCTWHGKVKTPQMRIHFSWPIRASEPLYVVYVGPKITKR